jgi:hypothetical protein
MGGRGPFNWLHAIAFAAVVSLTVWVIYDLEMPRYGLIRVDNYDHLLRDLRDGFTAFDAQRTLSSVFPCLRCGLG